MAKKIKIGVIGVGRIGKMHIENMLKLSHLIEIIAIADSTIDSQKDWAKSVGIDKCYSNYNELLKLPEIEAVFIFTSTDMHAKISIDAANAKKHIFCEKPLDVNVKNIKSVMAAIEKNGVKIMLGFNRRFDHNFSNMQKLIKNGDIGSVQVVKITSRDPKEPDIEFVKRSGGLFIDFTIHDFDTCLFMNPVKPKEIFAYGSTLINQKIAEAGDIDTAVVSIKFENDSLAIIDNSRQALYGYDQRVEVFGSKGTVIAHNDRPTNVETWLEKGMISDKPFYAFPQRYADSYKNEVEFFCSCILNNTTIPQSIHFGLEPIRMALAAGISLKENRAVKLSEIET